MAERARTEKGSTSIPIDLQPQTLADHVEHCEPEPKIAWSTILAVFVSYAVHIYGKSLARPILTCRSPQFLGLTYVPAIATAFVMPTQILQQIGSALGDTENIAWILGGWSIGAAVSFFIAGGFSDVFSRRWVSLSGQNIILAGAVSILSL
jgi:MFS family permease